MIPNCSLQTAWGGIAMVKLSDPGRLKCLRAVQLPRRRCPPAGRMGAAAAGTRRGRQLTAQRRAREECVTIPTKPQENAETQLFNFSSVFYVRISSMFLLRRTKYRGACFPRGSPLAPCLLPDGHRASAVPPFHKCWCRFDSCRVSAGGGSIPCTLCEGFCCG